MSREFQFSLIGLVLLLTPVAAQPPDVATEIGSEHKWLAKFAGEWTVESKANMGPDQPAIEGKGTVSSRMVGSLWVINEMKSEMAGTKVLGVQTIGFDAEKKKYVGTWVDSMTNYLWHYEGSVDEAGTKLTLEAEGPDFESPGKTALYRDAYEFKSPDLVIATSSLRNKDGQWVVFMTGEMKRNQKK